MAEVRTFKDLLDFLPPKGLMSAETVEVEAFAEGGASHLGGVCSVGVKLAASPSSKFKQIKLNDCSKITCPECLGSQEFDLSKTGERVKVSDLVLLRTCLLEATEAAGDARRTGVSEILNRLKSCFSWQSAKELPRFREASKSDSFFMILHLGWLDALNQHFQDKAEGIVANLPSNYLQELSKFHRAEVCKFSDSLKDFKSSAVTEAAMQASKELEAIVSDGSQSVLEILSLGFEWELEALRGVLPGSTGRLHLVSADTLAYFRAYWPHAMGRMVKVSDDFSAEDLKEMATLFESDPTENVPYASLEAVYKALKALK